MGPDAAAEQPAPGALLAAADEAGWRALLARLRARRPVVVGHNLVWDLAFLHAMFVGPLPAAAADFGRRVGALFPRLVDTKLLLRRDARPDDAPDESLEELFLALQNQAYPFVRPASADWGFPRPAEAHAARAHRAGFDSGWPGSGLRRRRRADAPSRRQAT